MVSKARQYIEPLPGLVPVYIRPGDTPLEDINLDLAEAFESYARKHGRMSFARASDIPRPSVPTANDIQEEPEKRHVIIDDGPFQIPVVVTGLQYEAPRIETVRLGVDDNKISEENETSKDSQHIQKIHRS